MFTKNVIWGTGVQCVFVELGAKELEWPSGHSFVLKKELKKMEKELKNKSSSFVGVCL